MPGKVAREVWLALGRRAGKSRICALIDVGLAVFGDYSSVLAISEVGVVLLVAPSQHQARVSLNYVTAFLRAVPFMARTIIRETEWGVELSNNITVDLRSGNFKTVRGFTVVAIIDEVAFFPTEDSALPDTELLAAIRPAMASVPNSLLICSSTPYAQRGELCRAYQKYFGNDDSALLQRVLPGRQSHAGPGHHRPSVPG